jgi:thymidylate synthase
VLNNDERHGDNVFTTVQEAYVSQLRTTFFEPEYRNAPRGNLSVERLGVSLRVLDPVQRHIGLKSRRVNPVFNFAEALWYLSGSDELDYIGYYAPGMSKYSADGKTLQGTAYGPRIFRYGDTKLDQWQTILDTLAQDPDSKRAVIQIFDPHELRTANNIDVACTLGLQYFIREGRLCGTGFMRANDAFRGFVSDIFSFTFLLEFLARQIGLDVGTYTHMVGSLHVYDSDREWAQEVLRESQAGPAAGAGNQFPQMPAGDNWPYLREVLEWEYLLRANRDSVPASRLDALALPGYWKNVVGLFELHRQIRHETQCDPEVLALLPELFQDAMTAKWPTRFPQTVLSNGLH